MVCAKASSEAALEVEKADFPNGQRGTEARTKTGSTKREDCRRFAAGHSSQRTRGPELCSDDNINGNGKARMGTSIHPPLNHVLVKGPCVENGE